MYFDHVMRQGLDLLCLCVEPPTVSPSVEVSENGSYIISFHLEETTDAGHTFFHLKVPDSNVSHILNVTQYRLPASVCSQDQCNNCSVFISAQNEFGLGATVEVLLRPALGEYRMCLVNLAQPSHPKGYISWDILKLPSGVQLQASLFCYCKITTWNYMDLWRGAWSNGGPNQCMQNKLVYGSVVWHFLDCIEAAERSNSSEDVTSALDAALDASRTPFPINISKSEQGKVCIEDLYCVSLSKLFIARPLN